MLIWDDSKTLATWLAADPGTETTTMASLLMNLGYKKILAMFRRDLNTDKQTASTVASQRSYMLPPNFLRIVNVSFTYGGVLTPLEHVQKESLWDRFAEYGQTSARPERFFINNRFGAMGSELLLDPIPSVVGTLTIIYEATDRDLAATKYTTGSVQLTNNSTAVVGSGTTFINAMVGRYLSVTDATGDGFFYRVASYTSATRLDLETVYDGTSLAGLNYQIAEAFALPEEMQILPVYYFLQHYFSRKQNTAKIREYKELYDLGLAEGRQAYNSKDDSARVFNASKYRQGAWPVYPGHFPQQVT